MFSGKQLGEVIKQVLFVLMIVSLIVLIFIQLSYFVSSILGAITLYLLLRQTHLKLQKKGWSNSAATSFLLTLTILFVFVVGGILFGVIYSKVKDFQPQLLIDNVDHMHDFLLEKTGYNIFSKDITDNFIRSFGSILPNIFSATGSVLLNGMMMMFVLYFMLQGNKKMESTVEEYLPLSSNSVLKLKKEVQNMVVSNAIGIPVILIGQALFAGVAYWILGAGDPIVWGLLTGIFGLIPVIGTAGIWAPLAVNLFSSGFVWQGVVLVVYGALVVSSIDNVIRMVFLKKYANVHPLTAIFGIILGMNLLGFWGIIFGPLMISGGLLLLKIYRTEFFND